MGSTSIMKRFTAFALGAVLAVGLMPAIVQPNEAGAAEPATGTVATQAKHYKVKKVTGVELVKAGKTFVKVKWDNQKNATKYQVKYSLSGRGGVFKKATEKNSYKIEGMMANQGVRVKVRAYCEGGPTDGASQDWSAWSDRVEFRTEKK